MTEEQLNIKYIKEKTGLLENDELISIILEMINDCYRKGLEQSRFDKIMLQQEIEKLNNELEIGKEQYNDLIEEKEKLQEKIDLVLLENQELKKMQCTCLGTGCQAKMKEYKSQQKEFIEYMNKVIKELELLETGPGINNIDEELNGYLIQRVNTFKEILSKYKEIIGGKDD